MTRANDRVGCCSIAPVTFLYIRQVHSLRIGIQYNHFKDHFENTVPSFHCLKMANYITTHDSSAKAIFSNNVQEARTKLDTPIGNMEMLYTTHKMPVNVASESDIDQYSKDSREGLGNRLCPEEGTAAAILNISPNSVSPFHRTMTLDIFLVIEGVLELELDSGERRTLHAGDCVTQRVSIRSNYLPWNSF